MRLAVGLGAVVLLLSACSGTGSVTAPSASPTIAVLDDGALTITPLQDSAPTVTPDQVRQDLALSYEQTVQKLGALTLGRVHWGPGLWVGAPKFAQDRAAWVQFWQDSTDLMPDDPKLHSCSGAGINPRPSPTPVSQPSRQHALVVDAETGAAAIYDGAGPSACYTYSAPLAFAATRKDSVPWTSLGGANVRVSVPPCGVSEGGWRNSWTTWQALATRPFGACPEVASSQVLTGVAQLTPKHAPVGPFCARIAEGVPLTRPPDCVN